MFYDKAHPAFSKRLHLLHLKLHTFGRWKEDKVYDERACGKGPSGMRFRNGTESRNLLPLWKRDGKLLLFLRIKHKK